MSHDGTTAHQRSLRKNALVGLLWWDYRRHREGFLLGLPSVTVCALLIGLVENAGGPMFLWMGLAMGVGCGLGFGRGEWSEGLEEFSLGLPPTRRDRYLVRLGLGLAFLGWLLFLGLAAGPLGWVRALWEALSFDMSHYRAEAPIWEAYRGPGFYALAIGLTLATYVECFATAMAVERPGSTWAMRFVPVGLGLAALVSLDLALFPGRVGFLTGAVGLAFAAVRARTGLASFERKDAVLGPARGGSGGGGGSTAMPRLLAVLLGLTVLLVAGVWALIARS